MHTPEWFEKRDICSYLDSIDCWYFKPTTRGFGGSGIPDIIACWEGKFISIEVKRQGKEPTEIQWNRMHEITAHGGIAFWGTAAKVINEINTRFSHLK